MPEILFFALLGIVSLPVVALILVLVYATATRAVHRLDGEAPTKGPRQEQEG